MERRVSIVRRGLLPHQPPVTSSPGWRPPYTCFAEDPLWAWLLSGNVNRIPAVWDLWMVYLEPGHEVTRIRHDPPDREALRGHTHIRWREWRVHDKIYQSEIHWVGSRPGDAFSIHRRPSPHWPKPYTPPSRRP
jgi:hypothetical protein